MEYQIENSESVQVSDPPGVYDPGKDFTTLDALRKVSISITASISEGYGRYHYHESIQFYRIARGSMYELKDHPLHPTPQSISSFKTPAI